MWMATSSSLVYATALLLVWLISVSQSNKFFAQNELSQRIQSSRLKPKLLEPPISITAQLPNPLSDESLQIREFIPEKVLHKRLPWSAKLLLRFFKNPLTKSKKETFPAQPLSSTTTMSRVKLLFPFLDHPWIKPILEKLSPVGKSVLIWIRMNKDIFLAGAKVFAGVYILLTIARRIIHWYTGVAEYELLLDQHDFDYQTYGVHMDGFGSWILSRVDKTDVENCGYSESYHRIETALNKPCFPYAMNTYALHMGNELAEIVADVDVRVRAMRKGFQRANKELQLIQQQQKQLQTSPSTAYNRDVAMKSLVTARNAVKDYTRALTVESDVTLVLQKALVILSVRQADAYLRATRMLILMEANNCEDLLKSWREKLAKKSQTLRIPVFQNVLAKIIGFTTGSRLKNMSKQQHSLTGSFRREVEKEVEGSLRGHSTTSSSRDRREAAASTSPHEEATSGTAATTPATTMAVTSVNDDDDVDAYSTNLLVKDLNAKEKVILLENLLKNLYIVSGRIQRHLEVLQQYALPFVEPNDEIFQDDQVWQQLESWVAQTSTLTLEAVHALSFQPTELAAQTKKAFSSGSGSGSGSRQSMFASSSPTGEPHVASAVTSTSMASSSSSSSSSSLSSSSSSSLSATSRSTGDHPSWGSIPRDATALAMASSSSSFSPPSSLIVNGSLRRRMFLPGDAVTLSSSPPPPSSSSSTAAVSVNQHQSMSHELPNHRDPQQRHQQQQQQQRQEEEDRSPSRENDGHRLPAAVMAELRRLATITTASDLLLPVRHIPVVEFLIPVSTSTLVEHGLLSAMRWETVLRRTGAQEVHVPAWQTEATPTPAAAATATATAAAAAFIGHNNNRSTAGAAIGIREIVFQQQNQPPPPPPHSTTTATTSSLSSEEDSTATGSLPTWTQRQSLTQVLPLTPARVTYTHHEQAEPAAIYAMATFQRFLSSSWAYSPSEATTTTTAAAAAAATTPATTSSSPSTSTSSFPASIVMYNATTRWIFAPASTADLIAWRQRTSPRPSVRTTPPPPPATVSTRDDGDQRRAAWGPRLSSFVRHLFGREATSSSSSSSSRTSDGWSIGAKGPSVSVADRDGAFLWTKVQVSVDIQVPPSMYRYYIASVVLGDTKRLVEAWKTTVDEFFLRDEAIVDAADLSLASSNSGSSGRVSDGEDDEVRRLFHRETIHFAETAAAAGAAAVTAAASKTLPHPQVMLLSGGTAQPWTRPSWASTATTTAAGTTANPWESHSPSKAATTAGPATVGAAGTTTTTTTRPVPAVHDIATATTAMSTYPWAATSPPSTTLHQPAAVAFVPPHRSSRDGRTTTNTPTTPNIPTPTAEVSFTPTTSSHFPIVDHHLFRDLHRLDMALTHHERQLIRLRTSWQTSGVILKDLTRVSQTFATHLQTMGLRKRMYQGIYAILRVRVMVSLIFWTSLSLAGFELNKRSEDISWGVDFLWKTSQRFVKRRIAKPTWSIVNDVILNQRTKITDVRALSDAQRSLRAMLYDFLLQHNPGMSETERQRLATAMDMRPISEAYEQQLKHPMRNIVRGSIARLVLIQLQFVKKELLVAMQAIDELFNANQVNLQLLAVTPAILAVLGLQVMGRLVTSAVKATTKGGGTMMESAAAVYRDVKLHLREIERVLVNSEAYRTVDVRGISHGGRDHHTAMAMEALLSPSAAATIGNQQSTAGEKGVAWPLPPPLSPLLPSTELSAKEWGEILSILHRIHLLLMIHSGTFEAYTLQQLQEDLRDMVRPGLSVQQRLSIVERIHRHYAFLQSTRRMFGGGFMQ